jgi:arabinose-5-phosphate isomerase
MTALAMNTYSENFDENHANLVAARAALQTEIEGMQELLNALDGSFLDAVETIEEMKKDGKGRLVITGMGKSGHVGRKMAATFASTGTPSIFVHPGEASHGDLGMITNDDVVIAISFSGEAPELSDIIAYTRRFSIPLIAMTSRTESALGSHCDICLLLPRSPEACPNGLAPTTSTTCTMALGDALAVTILKNMNLTAEQFKIFHPGGKLGQKLMKVTDIMDKLDDLPLVAPDMRMDEALIVMTQKNLGCLLAHEEGQPQKLKGIITDGDLKRHMGADLLTKKVSDIMTENPKSISDSLLAAEAVDVMTTKFKQPITSLVVMNDDQEVVGLLRMQSCLQAGVI